MLHILSRNHFIGLILCCIFFSSCSKKHAEISKIDLTKVDKLTGLSGFQLFNDSLELKIENSNKDILKQLQYRTSYNEVIVETNRLVVLKIDLEYQKASPAHECNIIIEYRHHFLNELKAFVELTNDSILELKPVTIFDPYDFNNFKFQLQGKTNEFKSVYLLMKPQSHSAYANILFIDYDFYLAQVPRKNFLAGSFIGAFIILIFCFFLMTVFYDLHGLKALAIYSVCCLLLVLVDTGWLRSFIRYGTQEFIWLDEFLGYFVRYLNVFAAVYAAISILKRHYFANRPIGKRTILTGKLIVGFTFLLGIIHYGLAVQKPFPPNSIFLFTNIIYILLVLAAIYAQSIFVFLAIKNREFLYYMLASIFTIHSLALIYLILHDLNIFTNSMNNVSFLRYINTIPVLIYLPLIFDWVLLFEVTIILLSVFYIINQNIELHSRTRETYVDVKQKMIEKVYEVEKAGRNSFGGLLEEGVVKKISDLSETIASIDLKEEDQNAFNNLFEKLRFQMNQLIDQNNDDVLGLFTNSIESLTTTVQSDVKHIKIIPNIDDNINQLPQDVKNHVFSIIKEAINNTIKHSGADKITLEMLIDEDVFVLNIEDNGSGFQRRKLKVKGNGLINMENRVNVLGGEWRLSSKLSYGTSIHIIVPIKNA